MGHITESYLDNAATTPTRSEVIERMNEVIRDAWGNPSSAHAVGMRAKEVLEESRATIAGALGVEPGEVYFTSGATESNNLAVRGVCSARRDNPAKIITSTLEHASVTRSVRGMRREMNWPVTYIDAIDGKLDLGQLRDALTESPTSLITIMNVQNEVGYIFPSAEIGRMRDELAPDALYHVDATQAFGKLSPKPREWHAELASVASHKIGGPRGIGALYVRDGVKMHTNAFGGGQEHGLRSGTEPVFLAAGFARAVELAQAEHEETLAHVRALSAQIRADLAPCSQRHRELARGRVPLHRERERARAAQCEVGRVPERPRRLCIACIGVRVEPRACGGGYLAQEAPTIAPSGGHPALAGQHDAARELLRRDDV